MRLLRTLVLLIVVLLVSASAPVRAEEKPVTTGNEVVASAPEAAPAWASNWRSQPEPMAKAGGSMVLGLSACIALLSVGVWAAKRFGLVKAPGRKGGLNIIERTPLSQKTSLCLVEARGKQFLIAVGSERVSLISNMSVGDGLETEQSFEEFLCEKPQPISAC